MAVAGGRRQEAWTLMNWKAYAALSCEQVWQGRSEDLILTGPGPALGSCETLRKRREPGPI